MSRFIHTHLASLELVVTFKEVEQIEKAVFDFENTAAHITALNSNLLGVYPMAFTSNHRQRLFDIFGISEREFGKLISKIPSIDTSHKVESDPFNVLCTWIIHLGMVYLKDSRIRHEFTLNVAKLLNYKFFTSLVNNFFKHGAREETMMAVINSLSNKFDIRKYETWRRVIEARSRDMVAEASTNIHYERILHMDVDAKFLYFITDAQTRMRDKIKLIANEYYDFKEKGVAISSKGATTQDLEGEKALVQVVSTQDAKISKLKIDVQVPHRFIDNHLIAQIVGQFQAISPTHLRSALSYMSQTASLQVRSKKADEIMIKDGDTIYVGIPLLIAKIIESLYRYCIDKRLPIKSQETWMKIRFVLSSSRASSPDIIRIKNSIKHFLDGTSISPREATLSSLRLALILYIFAKTLTDD